MKNIGKYDFYGTNGNRHQTDHVTIRDHVTQKLVLRLDIPKRNPLQYLAKHDGKYLQVVVEKTGLSKTEIQSQLK